MHVLEAVSQHGTVDLVQNVLAHLDPVVQPDTDDAGVVGRVVDLEHGEAVRDDRLAALGVRLDVRGSSSVSCLSRHTSRPDG